MYVLVVVVVFVAVYMFCCCWSQSFYLWALWLLMREAQTQSKALVRFHWTHSYRRKLFQIVCGILSFSIVHRGYMTLVLFNKYQRSPIVQDGKFAGDISKQIYMYKLDHIRSINLNYNDPVYQSFNAFHFDTIFR